MINLRNDIWDPQICPEVHKLGLSRRTLGKSGHLGSHLEFWEMLKGKLNLPGRLFLWTTSTIIICREKNYISQVTLFWFGSQTIAWLFWPDIVRYILSKLSFDVVNICNEIFCCACVFWSHNQWIITTQNTLSKCNTSRKQELTKPN